ncbi:MAG: PilZ domain-containing protein [Spirochaetes bacterium]|nr:PilZ domain-containing protein [Spirochaetota bacterium]
MVRPIKPAFKRPLLHHLFIILYIAAPFANILLLRVFVGVPLARIFSRIVAGYGILATIWLFTSPVIGVALYFANRVSWYLFLGHSSLILLDFIIKWASRPVYYAKTVPGAMNILITAGNLALIILIGFIIQRNFRAPYFQVLNRSWRERKRIPIHHTVLLDGQSLVADDLSALGCFVHDPGTNRTVGSRVEIRFLSDSLTIECPGEIMRTTGTGLGIRFIGLPRAQKRDIDRMLRKRFSLRQKVDLACTCTFEQAERPAIMLNLSNGGCYLQSKVEGLREEAPCTISLPLQGDGKSYQLPGKIVWINRAGQDEKPVGFGCEFDKKQPAMMRYITLHYGQGMLIR